MDSVNNTHSNYNHLYSFLGRSTPSKGYSKNSVFTPTEKALSDKIFAYTARASRAQNIKNIQLFINNPA